MTGNRDIIPNFAHDILVRMDYLSFTPFTLHFDQLLLLRPTQDARTFHYICLSTVRPPSEVTSLPTQKIELGPFNFYARNFYLQVTSPTQYPVTPEQLITATNNLTAFTQRYIPVLGDGTNARAASSSTDVKAVNATRDAKEIVAATNIVHKKVVKAATLTVVSASIPVTVYVVLPI